MDRLPHVAFDTGRARHGEEACAVSATTDPRRLFSDRQPTYSRFIRAVRYPQGLRAFFDHSGLLRSDLRILDAGCGTGALTFAVYDALAHRGYRAAAFHAFDLTPAMLDALRTRMKSRRIEDIELAEADVLRLDDLPPTWSGYDLVVSASMMEYLPRERIVEALAGLRGRLAEDGALVLFMTRRNPLTRLMIGRWWASNLYDAAQLSDAFRRAGFTSFRFRSFPRQARHLSVWGHIVEARR